MKNDNKKLWLILGAVGLLVPVWLAVLIAPTLGGGLPVMIPKLGDAFSHPFRFTWCDVTLPCVVVFTAIYGLILIVYHYTKPNYRRREEHGSAKWGEAKEINKKYHQAPEENNKLLTQNVSIGYNAKLHRRNFNTLVVGGSGAGKTRFYVLIANVRRSFLIPCSVSISKGRYCHLIRSLRRKCSITVSASLFVKGVEWCLHQATIHRNIASSARNMYVENKHD